MQEFKQFLSDLGRSENTIKNYLSDISIYIKDKENYLNPEKFSPATLERRKNALNLYLKFLNIDERITKKFNKKILFQKDCIKNEDIKNLFEVLEKKLKTAESFKEKKKILQNRISISLGVNEGLRVSEYKNLEFEKKEIEIRNSKGNSFRTIPLTNYTLEKIKDLYEFLDKPKGFVFENANGKFINIRTFQLWLVDAGTEANIPREHLGTHSLRHRFARNYLKINSGRIEQLGNILGHMSIQTTLMYTLPSRDEIKSGMNNSSITNFWA